jgi:NAD(P)-dependent dehydrogenase (short-subunit alcohol dehydrogenase family)
VGSLQGKSILVTGASRGIGADSAKALAAAGARLSLVGLEPEGLEETARACGPDAVFFEADITDTDAVERAVAQTVERLGSLDGLLANAGLAGFGSVRTIDPAAFERTIEVNLLGTWRTVRAALDPIIASRGYILTVASVAAVAHPPGLAAYAASKAGIEAFCDSLRWEVAHLGVDVGVGYFSWIHTDLTEASEEHPGFLALRSSLRGPLAKVHPVDATSRAIVRGFERRSAKVVAPGWVRGLLALRGQVDRLSRRDMLRAAPEVVRRSEEEVARRGAAEASIPQRDVSRVGFDAASKR